MKTSIKLLFLFLILLLNTNFAKADDVYTFVVHKQEAKKPGRWSLSDWLDTRDRMRMMDLWLAIHSPTPYEFYIEGDYLFSNGTSTVRHDAANVKAAAYASIFGLSGDHDWAAQRTEAVFLLRIFGLHAQATNITLLGGMRWENYPETVHGALAGLASTIYITKYVGFDGSYKYFFKSAANSFGTRSSGYRFEVGPFIDFKFFRVLGAYFSDHIILNSGSPNPADRHGILIGGRLFF